MKRSVDYRAQYEEEMRFLNEGTEENNEPYKQHLGKFHLLLDLAEAQQSQFKKIKSEERRNKLESVFYPMLCEIADVSNGYAELDIDEDLLCGTLIYKGRELHFYSPFDAMTRDFKAIMSAADGIYIDMDEEWLVVKLEFNLFYKVRIADHSKEIEEIKRKLHSKADE